MQTKVNSNIEEKTKNDQKYITKKAVLITKSNNLCFFQMFKAVGRKTCDMLMKRRNYKVTHLCVQMY